MSKKVNTSKGIVPLDPSLPEIAVGRVNINLEDDNNDKAIVIYKKGVETAYMESDGTWHIKGKLRPEEQEVENEEALAELEEGGKLSE
jgi:hypothetical protein